MDTDGLIKALSADAGRPKPAISQVLLAAAATRHCRCGDRLCRHHRPASRHSRRSRDHSLPVQVRGDGVACRDRLPGLVGPVAAPRYRPIEADRADGRAGLAARCDCGRAGNRAFRRMVGAAHRHQQLRLHDPDPVNGHCAVGAVRRCAALWRTDASDICRRGRRTGSRRYRPPPSMPPTAPTIRRCSLQPGTRLRSPS